MLDVAAVLDPPLDFENISIFRILEAYPGLSQPSKMECFATIVDGF